MTEPVNRVYGIREAGRKSGQEGMLKSDRKKQREEHADEDDTVDISEEARDRASGKRRKNILEYIESS